MTQQQWMVVACALVALGLGTLLALGGCHRHGIPRPRVRMVLARLVITMCPVFLIFSSPGGLRGGELPVG